MSIKINPGVTLGAGVSVKIPVLPVSLTITPIGDPDRHFITIPRFYSLQLGAIATFANSSTQDYTSLVTWSSDSNTVATVDSSGLATGNEIGQTTFRAVYQGVSATKVVTVPPVTLVFIGITPPSPAVARSGTQQLTATGTFADGTELDLTHQTTWSSSNDLIATVDTNGLVTGQSGGACTIHATSNGVQGSATLHVSP